MKFLKFKQNALAILTFRKWGRKNYSLFLTMKRMVVISVLSVVYHLSTPIDAYATKQDTSEVKMQYDLDEIEVSAQRSPAMYSQVARIISVIESKEIESIPAQSIQDLLEYIAGVDVRQRGTEGVQADVSVRGGTFDQTLILLNGINITDPQTGHHNLNLPVSLNQIERIEILEGPAARVYGPNAFSGAVNFVTKQPGSKSIRAQVSGGSFGYFDGNLSGSFKAGKFNHMVALNRKKSDGYINNTDFKNSNAFYSGELDSKNGILKFQAGASLKGFGANSFYTPKYPNQYEETKTLFTSLKWEGNGKLHLTPVVYYRRHHDRFELFRDNPASWYKTHNYHLTNVYGSNLNSWFRWAGGKTALGIEYRSENILSNILGVEMDSPKNVPGEDAVFTRSDSRSTISGFIEHAAYLNNWSLTAGILSNNISGSNLGVNFFPGIDISYDIPSLLKLFTSYNTALRMPTFTDLYYDGPNNTGNPDLKPEKSATIEGGVKLNKSVVKGHFVIFYRQGKDIIDWVKLTDDEVWQPKNLTRINTFGTEASVNLYFKEKYGSKYPNIKLSYHYNSLEKEKTEYISNYVMDNLKHKFSGSINQTITSHISVDLKAVFQDREGSYTKFEDKVSVGEVPYDPFWIFDGKVLYRNRGITVFLSLNNIFDVKYNDIGNVVQPGRWLKTGVSYKINIK
ncbi:MAG: TonB-dependent receptor [Bacteroidota bacterium]